VSGSPPSQSAARETDAAERAVGGSEPFHPPPYPYERLRDLRAIAEKLPGGVVDCSIGTPCDPPPDAVVAALGASGTERGYPPSAGTVGFREAAAAWLARSFGVVVDPGNVAACVGTKEMVASTPRYLHLREPGRDTVLVPAVAYPTYAMGAVLAGCRVVSVPPVDDEGGGMDFDAVDPQDARRALLAWVNSPANPSGTLADFATASAWGRRHGVPVFSDECYVDFTWAAPGRSILEEGADGVVAVHSLSKRSNLAGVRAGFFSGDPGLVTYLREVRQHAGLIVPGPVQAAAVVALSDEAHVAAQRARYLERLELLAGALCDAGIPAQVPEGTFYLWPGAPDRWGNGWELAEDLAGRAGLLVSPGVLYGEGAERHVRVAVVQPTERLELVAERLAASSWR
jgi:succinyldiaminopimelate transaminase